MNYTAVCGYQSQEEGCTGMIGKDGNMEIHVRYTDGDTSRFAMTDTRTCLALIESIRPSEFFHQPLLRIQGGKRTSILIMKSVESIYFATSRQAKIRNQPPARDFRTIPETQYLEKLTAFRRQYESSKNLFVPGQSIDTLLTLHCVSGKKHFLQVEIIVGHRADQLMDLHNRLERLTSVIPCTPEGYIAINPRNIKRIELYPAPPEAMHTAWLVD